ncbi:unnamed protein product [Adineta ricciae]|uniref:Uncharacterized protein n=1 Tax=Adineta ricciae TaxID=249248 RepID=A0A815GV88_ADIRI|nr:unnamed protein product [Adineta ricciae]CAF1343395.1 unnamed protein product [Adineta ricciae]
MGYCTPKTGTDGSPATKLKTLLNKAKPSIQYEVCKKKPQPTSEFLKFAKEAEELMQLSNLTFPTALGISHESFSQSTPTSIVPSYSASQNNYPYTNSRNSNHRNQKLFSHSSALSSQNRSTPGTTFSQQSQPRNSAPTHATSNRPSPRITNSNTNNITPPRQPTVNVIDLPQSANHVDLLSHELSSILRSRCNQLGHEASVCSSF